MSSSNKQTNSQDPQLILSCSGAAGEHGEQRPGDQGQDDLGHDDLGQDAGHPRLSLSQVTYDKMEQIQDAVLAHHRHQFEGIKKVNTLKEACFRRRFEGTESLNELEKIFC